MSRPFKNNFAVRGRLIEDPILNYVESRTKPGEMHTVCHFKISVPLRDKLNTVVFYKFTAWDSVEKGVTLASNIAQNFEKGQWISITRSVPNRDMSLCLKCHGRIPAYNAFTVYEIDDFDMMKLDDIPTDSQLQDELTTLNLEEIDDGNY